MLKARTILVTFGDGSTDFVDASRRLTAQAQELKLFEKVVCLDSANLQLLVPEYSDFVSNATGEYDRFFYFRYAKAFAIKSVLVGNHGHCDQVIYLDAGCEVVNNPIARVRLKRFLKTAFKHPIGMAQEIPYVEENYTKRAVLLALEASLSECESLQIQDTVVVLNQNSEALRFINNWISFSNPELDLWQDPLKSEDNLIAHRHDQSIFSILWKRNHGGISNFYWNTSRAKSRLFDALTCTYAIQAIRNRTGESIISKSSSTSFFAMFIGVVFLPISRVRRRYLNRRITDEVGRRFRAETT
jgi:hypothetical protein